MQLKLGIALSGGGARGIAHIGVLKALEEEGIHPDVISGVSAGSIVGTLYAAGKTPDEILEFAKDSRFWKVFRVGLPYDGLTKLTYLVDRLEDVLEVEDFEQLSKKLFIGIANLNTGLPEVISQGKLFDIVMASCSVPFVFKPVEINGQVYVDGGLLENLLVEPLVPHTDRIIGVNVMPNVKVENKAMQTVIGIALRCFELSVYANTIPSLQLCDLVIEPPELYQYNIFQFNKWQPIFEHGYQKTKGQMKDIVAMLDHK